MDSCPKWDILIFLCDFNATTVTDRDGYESCVGPDGSGSRDVSSSMLFDLHRWTWYSNSGGGRKEIDHLLLGCRCRLDQNCRVFRSAEFAGTDHRFPQKIRLKSHVALSKHLRLNVRRIGNESSRSSNGNLRKISAKLKIPTSDDPENL